MYCGKCGSKNEDGKAFCKMCGMKLEYIDKVNEVTATIPRSISRDYKRPQENETFYSNPDYMREGNGRSPKSSKNPAIIALSILLCILLIAGAALIILNFLPQSEQPINEDTKIPFEAYASSELQENGKKFDVYNLRDYDSNTCWAEGVDGSGVGEKVNLTFEEQTEIQEIGILGGYCKNEELYYANARPKLLNITLIGESDSMTFEVGADDSFGTYTKHITNAYHKPVKQIEITIADVYEGSKYDDTCISEIYVK